MPVLLAIDQGTTSSRAVVFDPTTFTVLGSAQQEIEQHYPADGWVEHEPEEIWYSVARTVREALANAGVDASEVAAIGITNQRETVLLWERASGRPVSRAIVWQDRRTAAFCRERKTDEPMLKAKTGLVLDPYFSGTKLRWVLENKPEVKTAAEQGQLAAGTVDSFLIWRLTGGKVHATDTTNASRTLLFNIHHLQWDEELLTYFGVPRKLLPEVKPSVADFGTTKGLDFLPDGVPIRGVAGDQQAALFGQGCFAPGDAKCTYGTGAFYLRHTGDSPVSSADGLLTTVAAMPTGKPQYALEGAVFVAGAAVQWLRDGLQLFKSAAESEQLARESNPVEPVLFVPGFVGLGAPHWVPEARGAIFGLTRATTAADLARAALEGVAYQVADLVGDDGRSAALRADGGMARNDWFVQFQADVLGVAVLRANQSESTALGAAFLAGLGCGVVPGETALKAVLGTARRFEPAMGEAEREAKLTAWRKAVAAVVG
ncbi:MAG: glycerol kinase GlpK, partial [Fimbriiglobus sp.]|nr:glycerol kinase GlpK [Fimbriiglobus sp.]